MSYDFSMTAPLGPDGEHVRVGDFDLNYTYNVGPMFADAFGIRISEAIHGQRADIAGPKVADALAKLRAEPDKYRAMNPTNGWGNYEGAVMVLETLLAWCQELPRAYVRIS